MRRTLALAGRAAAAVGVVALVALTVPARAEAAPAWKLSWSTEFNGTALPTKCYAYGGPTSAATTTGIRAR